MVSGNGVSVQTTVKSAGEAAVTRSPKVRADLPIPAVGYLDRKVRLVPDLREVWSYINPFMLYGRHMGYRGDFEKRSGGAGRRKRWNCSTRWKK